MTIEIYGADWCGFCKKAISLCESNSLAYEYIDVDKTENLKNLEKRIGGRVKSVPQIFMDGQHIPGGFNGLKQQLSNN